MLLKYWWSLVGECDLGIHMVALPVSFVVVVLIMHAVYKAETDYILPLKNCFSNFIILIFRVEFFF